MFKQSMILLLAMGFLLSSCASMGKGTRVEKRQTILNMEQEALAKLYKQKPDTRSQIRSASGYAVFSNANVNLLVVSAGTGYGVVTNNKTGQKTYMNMAEGGVGFGAGVKDYRIVMVFHTPEAMDHFVNSGWSFGGNADATAKVAEKGVSAEGEAYYGDVTVYTFTESGLALQATVKGVKFWKDKVLNQ